MREVVWALLISTGLCCIAFTEPTSQPSSGWKLKPNAPEEVAAYWERMASQRDYDISGAKDALRGAMHDYRQVMQDPNRTAQAIAAARDNVNSAKAALSLATDPDYLSQPFMPDLQVGAIGTFNRGVTIHVLNVLDSQTILGMLYQADELVGAVELKGFSTEGLVSDKVIQGSSLGRLKATGTTTYTATTGSNNTVFVLKPFKIEDFLER